MYLQLNSILKACFPALSVLCLTVIIIQQIADFALKYAFAENQVVKLSLCISLLWIGDLKILNISLQNFTYQYIINLKASGLADLRLICYVMSGKWYFFK